MQSADFTRYTGSLNVAFQVKTSSGKVGRFGQCLRELTIRNLTPQATTPRTGFWGRWAAPCIG